MSEFRLPELELSEFATVSRWLKRPGESIGAHETLLELFSERFDWDITSPSAGVLKEIVAAEGSQAKTGAVLAVIDGAASDWTPRAIAGLFLGVPGRFWSADGQSGQVSVPNPFSISKMDLKGIECPD